MTPERRELLEDAGLLDHPDIQEDEVLAAEIADQLADLRQEGGW